MTPKGQDQMMPNTTKAQSNTNIRNKSMINIGATAQPSPAHASDQLNIEEISRVNRSRVPFRLTINSKTRNVSGTFNTLDANPAMK